MNYKNAILISILLIITSCASLFLETPNYEIYETEHYTFFYLPNSKVEKDIKLLAKYSEKAIEWFSSFTNVNFNMKVDVYMFDDKKTSTYYKTVNLFNVNIFESFSTNGTVYFYYNDLDYISGASIILHETTHVYQFAKLNLTNTALAEGYATYIGIKFYNIMVSYNLSDEEIFNNLLTAVSSGIKNGHGTPGQLFRMSIQEFQGVKNTNFQERNPGYRYEIAESFVLHLIQNYGLEKVKRWMKNTSTNNFESTFKEVFSTTFLDEENRWNKRIF